MSNILEKIKANFWMFFGNKYLLQCTGEGVKTGVISAFVYLIIGLPVIWLVFSYFEWVTNEVVGSIVLEIIGLIIAGIYPALFFGILLGGISGVSLGVWIQNNIKKTSEQELLRKFLGITGSISILLCVIIGLLSRNLFMAVVLGILPMVIFLISEIRLFQKVKLLFLR
ncbi:MAG: hypothetical protein JXA19_04930 [Anaerolineales bacterium]|nr:hypothetical protein [Anaerolineales bacterium]